MQTTHTTPLDSVPHPFIQRHQADVIGVLHGFDRLRLQGTLRSLYHPEVMALYLHRAGVLWKDFRTFVTGLTDRIRQAAADLAQQHHRPMIYLPSSATDKEDLARHYQRRDRVRSGLIVVLSAVEPCRTWFMRGNRATQRLELKLQWGKCLHFYFYWLVEPWGWLHVRVQTWFPFLVQICLNGREWLSRQLDAAGIGYRRVENCFPWIADLPRAQALMDQQVRIHWQRPLARLLDQCHPLHREIARPLGLTYYWTVAESEYASDVMFRRRAALERIYPALVHHAVMSFGAEQVLRFLGRRDRLGCNDEVLTDRRRGPEGVRVKHWLNDNSLKFYDKGSLLRSEATINEPKDFRVWRASERDPRGPKRWRILRRSVADLPRRAQVSRAATERHLSALAMVHQKTPLAQEAAAVCRPVYRQGHRQRALNPLGAPDAALLAAVNRGEYALNGFRNRDIRQGLYGPSADPLKRRRQMAAVGRRLRLLRAHGLIKRVPGTHRYVLSQKGQRIITALLAARQADVQQLTSFAA
jgi:hypothetical protein